MTSSSAQSDHVVDNTVELVTFELLSLSSLSQMNLIFVMITIYSLENLLLLIIIEKRMSYTKHQQCDIIGELLSSLTDTHVHEQYDGDSNIIYKLSVQQCTLS